MDEKNKNSEGGQEPNEFNELESLEKLNDIKKLNKIEELREIEELTDIEELKEQEELESKAKRLAKRKKMSVRIVGILLVLSILIAEFGTFSVSKNVSVEPIKDGIQIEQRGQVKAPYPIYFEASRGMLSRDGSEAEPVNSGMIAQKAGVYYLSLFDEKDCLKVETFEIAANLEQINEVKDYDGLVEVLKYNMENVKESFSFYAQKELLKEETIYKAIERVRDTYPVAIMPKSYRVSYMEDPGEDIYLTTMAFNYEIADNLAKEEYKANISHKMQTILGQIIAPDMTDLKREYSILDYIVKTTMYSKSKKNDEYPALTHTIYGAVIEGIAVCDGYSKELNYLLNAVGVPSRMIVGESRKQGHQWNQVKIGETFYHVDVTWADGGTLLEMRYINQDDKSMHFTHEWDREKYIACKETGPLLKPSFETKINLFSMQTFKKVVAIIPVVIIFMFVRKKRKKNSI